MKECDDFLLHRFIGKNQKSSHIYCALFHDFERSKKVEEDLKGINGKQKDCIE
jgi:hypothetical protein